MTPREWFRRLRFGLDTVLSLDRLGFFIPYRYARSVTPPKRYPAIEAMFEEALPEMASALDALEAVAEDLTRIARDAKAPEPRWDQDWFCGLDAAMLYAQIRQHRPAHVVEIGSGHSTRFAARAIADGGLATRLIAIDPKPRANLAALKVEWHRATLQEALENSGGDLLAALHPGDLLFVDSSHILMPGTDVELILAELLPRLPEGALVHIHDIFLPEAYPESWAWRGYNEQAAVAALLAGGRWDILFASRFARARFDKRLREGPLGAHVDAAGPATSLWLAKR
ncbi:class I SAM-dependent methyltransferase [Dongia deserti]|uniref:class I SAM-dependent methyltransferase n=1 Tax=Dongia deserti TaxID=2268030 RepID=UPI000E64D61C|nr:class I SAM-dependent methyltransferase [Dongia deserti]